MNGLGHLLVGIHPTLSGVWDVNELNIAIAKRTRLQEIQWINIHEDNDMQYLKSIMVLTKESLRSLTARIMHCGYMSIDEDPRFIEMLDEYPVDQLNEGLYEHIREIVRFHYHMARENVVHKLSAICTFVQVVTMNFEGIESRKDEQFCIKIVQSFSACPVLEKLSVYDLHKEEFVEKKSICRRRVQQLVVQIEHSICSVFWHAILAEHGGKSLEEL